MITRSDVVFATSEGLASAKRRLNPNTHVAPHGVDHARFSPVADSADDAVLAACEDLTMQMARDAEGMTRIARLSVTGAVELIGGFRLLSGNLDV